MPTIEVPPELSPPPSPQGTAAFLCSFSLLSSGHSTFSPMRDSPKEPVPGVPQRKGRVCTSAPQVTLGSSEKQSLLTESSRSTGCHILSAHEQLTSSLSESLVQLNSSLPVLCLPERGALPSEKSLTYSKGSDWRAQRFVVFGGNRSHHHLPLAFPPPASSRSLLAARYPPDSPSSPLWAHPHFSRYKTQACPA